MIEVSNVNFNDTDVDFLKSTNLSFPKFKEDASLPTAFQRQSSHFRQFRLSVSMILVLKNL